MPRRARPGRSEPAPAAGRAGAGSRVPPGVRGALSPRSRRGGPSLDPGAPRRRREAVPPRCGRDSRTARSRRGRGGLDPGSPHRPAQGRGGRLGSSLWSGTGPPRGVGDADRAWTRAPHVGRRRGGCAPSAERDSSTPRSRRRGRAWIPGSPHRPAPAGGRSGPSAERDSSTPGSRRRGPLPNLARSDEGGEVRRGSGRPGSVRGRVTRGKTGPETRAGLCPAVPAGPPPRCHPPGSSCPAARPAPGAPLPSVPYLSPPRRVPRPCCRPAPSLRGRARSGAGHRAGIPAPRTARPAW
ncbi:hypothetical protein FB570_103282 [Streptomyces sp. T12]|nr:hypothetical protein FB570_103282 [Streptomyces sp. T12]